MSVRLFSSFIIKTNKYCINCIHYMKHINNYPCDEIYDSENKLGKCSMFGKQDFVSGEIEYEYASACRNSQSKCGEEGTYFIKKNVK